MEVVNEAGIQTKPPGFHLAILPFADDIRDVPETATPQGRNHLHEQPILIMTPSVVDEAKVDIMKQIIQRHMRGKEYDPFAFPNPVLQKHHRVIEALALNLDIPEDLQDSTSPTSFADCQSLFDELQSMLPEAAASVKSKPATSAKRAKDSDDGETGKKVYCYECDGG